MTNKQLTVNDLFDEFIRGSLKITPKKPYETNKIGVIFDKSIPQDVLNIHLKTKFKDKESIVFWQ